MGVGDEPVPQTHELGLHHGGDLVVLSRSQPEQRVDLVDEDDARLQLLCEREHRCRQLLRLPVPSPDNLFIKLINFN